MHPEKAISRDFRTGVRLPSDPPNKNAEFDTKKCIGSAFLLPFRHIFALLSINFIVCNKKESVFRRCLCAGGEALFSFIKIMGYY